MTFLLNMNKRFNFLMKRKNIFQNLIFLFLINFQRGCFVTFLAKSEIQRSFCIVPDETKI